MVSIAFASSMCKGEGGSHDLRPVTPPLASSPLRWELMVVIAGSREGEELDKTHHPPFLIAWAAVTTGFQLNELGTSG